MAHPAVSRSMAAASRGEPRLACQYCRRTYPECQDTEREREQLTERKVEHRNNGKILFEQRSKGASKTSVTVFPDLSSAVGLAAPGNRNQTQPLSVNDFHLHLASVPLPKVGRICYSVVSLCRVT